MAKATSKQLTTRLSEQAVQNLAEFQAAIGTNQTAAVEAAFFIANTFAKEGAKSAREMSRVAVEQNAAPDALRARSSRSGLPQAVEFGVVTLRGR